jgi:hypothetical protein
MTSKHGDKGAIRYTAGADRARAWADRAAVIATLLIIVSGSLYGAVRFSLATGGLNWFQQAMDEPFYLTNILDLPFSLNSRSAGDFLGYFLLTLGIRNPLWITLVYDLVFPVTVFAMAYLVSKHFATQVIARLAWAIAMVFSFELLSFSSYLFFTAPPMVVLANAIGPNWLFSADSLPYFNLYRTPEPQVSWVVFFGYLYLLLRYCDHREPRIYQMLSCLNPLLCVVYSNIAIVLLLLYIMVSFGQIFYFRKPIAVWFVASAGATALAFWIVFTTAPSQLRIAQTVIASHLPILRLSIIYSLCGLVALTMRIRHRHWVLTPRDLVCGCLFMIPLITLNQQIVTGHTVIAGNWEYYVNYICIMTGAGLLLTRPLDNNPSRASRFHAAVAGGCWLGFLAMIAWGHIENVLLFAPGNVASLAQARAYAAAVRKVGPIDRVVTSHTFDDSLFLTRVPSSVRVLGSYNSLAWNGPPPMGNGETVAAHLARLSASATVGFEVLARRGITPAALQSELNDEVLGGYCWPALFYFFAYIDCWSPLSNYQHSKLALYSSGAIDLIVAGYRAYLSKIATAPPSEPMLVLASQPRGADFAFPFKQTLVSQAMVDFAGITASAYFYLQTSR